MISKKILSKKIITWLLLFLCIAELLFIIYFNLFQLRYHGGYDASSYFLKAFEMYKQKNIFCSNWIEQTSLYLDSPVPLAALLMCIFNNPISSYGMANILITLCIVIILNTILQEINMERISRLLCISLLLCPYLTIPVDLVNDLGYFSSLFISGGFYSIKILLSLLFLLLILRMHNGKISIGIILILVAGFFVSGLSSGYHILLLAIFPGISFIGFCCLKDKQVKYHDCLAVFCSVIYIALVWLGKNIAVNVLHFQSREGAIVWIGLKDLWENIGSVFLGNLMAINALPPESNIIALSPIGITYLLGLSIAIFLMSGLLWWSRIKIKKSNWYLFICWPGANVFFLSLIYSRYGNEIFEVRYLLPCVISEFVLLSIYINEEKIKKEQYSLILLITFCLLANSSYSITNFLSTKNNYDEIKILTSNINKTSIPFVYVYGDGISIEEKRNLRIFDTSKIYRIMDEINIPHGWGDYTYYNENSEYEGPTALLTTQNDFLQMPEYVKNAYKLAYVKGRYCLYIAERNLFDLESGFKKSYYNIDFPYSPGMNVLNGDFDVFGNYVSNGIQGWILLGPRVKPEPGRYKFILNYDIKESTQEFLGSFDVAVNQGSKILAYKDLIKGKNQIILNNISFEEDDELVEYRVNVTEGTIISIRSIEIYKID